MANMTSAVGTSADFFIGNEVGIRTDVEDLASANVVFAPREIKSVAVVEASKYTATSGYTYEYWHRTSGSTGNADQHHSEAELMSMASYRLAGKISVSTWVSTPTG